jgi:hypothetical protein
MYCRLRTSCGEKSRVPCGIDGFIDEVVLI